MIGSEKVFFDTPAFIYRVEDHPKYSIAVRNYIIDQVLNLDASLYTSTITLAEFY